MKKKTTISLLLCVAAGTLAGCTTTRAMLARPLGAADPLLTAIANVRVFDGVAEVLSEPMDVVLAQGRIQSVAPAGSAPLPEGAVRVEGGGKTLLPGLIDAHVHLGGGDGTPPWTAELPNVEAQAAALLYAGVTTALAAGHDCSEGLMRALDRGELPGPRVFWSSRIFTAPEGHPVPLLKALFPWPFASFYISARVRQPQTDEEARAQVAEELLEKPDFIKIMYDDLPVGSPHLARARLAAICDEAKRRGQRTLVHVASPEDAMESLEAGASVLMHIPWDGELTDEQVRRLAESKNPIVTTERIYGVMAAGFAGTVQFTSLEKETMPPGGVEAFSRKPEGYRPPGFSDEYMAAMPGYSEHQKRNAARLFAAGAHLVAGTDSGLPGVLHGPGMHRELQALVELGVPPAAALRLATSTAAKMLDPAADFGVVAPGMRADLLLVDGDPLADISATQRIAGVWRGGRPVVRGATE